MEAFSKAADRPCTPNLHPLLGGGNPRSATERYKVIGGKRRRITFHDLRHSFGTAAIGVLEAYKVQSYMGLQH